MFLFENKQIKKYVYIIINRCIVITCRLRPFFKIENEIFDIDINVDLGHMKALGLLIRFCLRFAYTGFKCYALSGLDRESCHIIDLEILMCPFTD